MGAILFLAPFSCLADDLVVGRKLAMSPMLEELDGSVLPSLPANAGKALLNQFLHTYPNARKHQFNQLSVGYENGGAALALKAMWVAEGGVLVEVEGLARSGRVNSSVIRRDTLVLSNDIDSSELLAFSGAEELRDPRGGSAIVIKAGNTAYLQFEPFDDYSPFFMSYHLDGYGDQLIFENIDPRFRERYDTMYKQADTPAKIKDFIVSFSKNDPDKRVREMFAKLIGMMRAQKTFEGFYNAYILIQDPHDLREASKLARNEEHKAQVENMAVVTLADKSRLFEIGLTPEATRSNSFEGGCWLFCKYNMTLARPIKGVLSVRLNPRSPIRLRYGRYRVTFNATVEVPRIGHRRSGVLGDYDGRSNQLIEKAIAVDLEYPSYSAKVDYNLGAAELAFFQRGSSGGYEAHWSDADIRVTFTYGKMELIN